MGTSVVAVLLVILHYLLVFDPSENPFPDSEDPTSPTHYGNKWKWRPNSFDEATVDLFSRLRQRLPGGRQRWKDDLTQAILVLCDVQLLTGLGILVSGYINLFRNAISAYHWRILVYLVWFSNLTHTSSLTLLRGYLNHHRLERICRFGLMFILWGGLLAAFIPTWWFGWFSGDPTGIGASNARCFYSPDLAKKVTIWRVCQFESINATDPNLMADDCMKHASYNDVWYRYSNGRAEMSALTSMILIFFSFFMRVVKMTNKFSGAMKTTFRTKPSNWLVRRMARRTNNATKGRFQRWMSHKILVIEITIYLVAKSYVDLISSDFMDVSYSVTLSKD
ncbi:hypothetical protein CGCSCA5_v013971 [Colletotrichum siamense]|nr:hypothetical protein CGCSCA5_v013971 [Colletotrichum siamense]